MEKKRKCLLQAISPFLTMFSSYISLLRQNGALCSNGSREQENFGLIYSSYGDQRLAMQEIKFILI